MFLFPIFFPFYLEIKRIKKENIIRTYKPPLEEDKPMKKKKVRTGRWPVRPDPNRLSNLLQHILGFMFFFIVKAFGKKKSSEFFKFFFYLEKPNKRNRI